MPAGVSCGVHLSPDFGDPSGRCPNAKVARHRRPSRHFEMNYATSYSSVIMVVAEGDGELESWPVCRRRCPKHLLPARTARRPWRAPTTSISTAAWCCRRNEDRGDQLRKLSHALGIHSLGRAADVASFLPRRLAGCQSSPNQKTAGEVSPSSSSCSWRGRGRVVIARTDVPGLFGLDGSVMFWAQCDVVVGCAAVVAAADLVDLQPVAVCAALDGAGVVVSLDHLTSECEPLA